MALVKKNLKQTQQTLASPEVVVAAVEVSVFGEALLLEGLMALEAAKAGTVPHALLSLGEPAFRDPAPTPHTHHLLLPLAVIRTVQHPTPGLPCTLFFLSVSYRTVSLISRPPVSYSIFRGL